MRLDPFETGGSSPPVLRANGQHPKPSASTDPVDPTGVGSTHENDLRALRERMRAPLIQSFLWRNCAAARFEEERTLVTRRWRRRK